MFDNQVTRNQFGQTNARDAGIFSDMYLQDESVCHVFIEDFDYYTGPVAAGTTNGYTLSGVGATVAEIAGDGGVVSMSALTTGFIASLQRATGNFLLQAGFRTWYRALASLSSLANSGQLIMGLTNFTAAPFTGGSITDGAWFSSAVATGALSFNVAVGGVVTTVALGVNLVAAALADFKFYWDGGIYASAPNGRIVYEASGAGVSAPVRGEVAAPANFPGATLLALQEGVKATAGTTVLNLDLLMVIKDRVNYLSTPTF